LGQINIALVSENPIEVYNKDEYDKMMEIDRLLDEKGIELKPAIIKGWFKLNPLEFGDSEAGEAFEICEKGRIWFVYDLDDYHYDYENIFKQFLDFQNDFNCEFIGYIKCKREFGAINKNHYAPKFDGSEPSKCSNCGSRVHFPEDGPYHPQFINQ